MKALKYLPIAAAILTTIAIWWTQAPTDSQITTQEPPKDRMITKHAPAEHFANQRAYPDASPDVRAYEAARQQAREQVQTRGNAPQGFDADWTVQGPGNIGARVNTVVVNPQNENIMYAGFSDGGVFRTLDGGTSWTPIFDDQDFLAIGDIVLDKNNPDIVYVGTGDPNISGLPSIGNGVYKSTDAGDTWTHLGLAPGRIVSKIVTHPSDVNTLYVGMMGLPFERNNDRGLYKTTDGGANWSQVLFVNDSTGIIDVLLDPNEPETLYAAAWTRVRNNFESVADSEFSQIWKTTDGGANWSVLGNGLPENDVKSRIGLAMSATNPQKIYAMYIDSADYQVAGIYRTLNGGTNWSPISISNLDNNAMGGFGWYFGKIRINPANDDDIFVLGVNLHRTPDAGNNWEQVGPPWWTYEVHADKHDMIFTPSGAMVLATDGGLYKSENNGVDWTDIENIPATQLYRTAYNPHLPNTYYGGAQDNGTTGGNASTINAWSRIFGGDGFQMAFHPTNPDIFFVEYQYGGLRATDDAGYDFFDLTFGFIEGERPNWDMPYIISAADSELMYAGAGLRVFRNTQGAYGFWEPISGDLVGTGGYRPSISTVAESPVNTNFLYAGTTNGKVWRSLDGGSFWFDISAGLPDRYVTATKPSPSAAERVFATVSGYKYNDNIPHVHRSDDNGNSWTDISGNLPQLAVNDIYILPEQNDAVLFVATDGGVYGTVDGGTNWDRLGGNMPMIPVFDLAWNETNNELVAATFARAVQTFPLDSILNPVNVVSPNLPQATINVFPNPATDYIQFNLENISTASAELVIVDAQGKVVYENKTADISAQIEVSSFPVGMYFVQIKQGELAVSSSFVKK